MSEEETEYQPTIQEFRLEALRLAKSTPGVQNYKEVLDAANRYYKFITYGEV